MKKKILHNTGILLLVASLLCGCSVSQEKPVSAEAEINMEEELTYALPKIGEAAIGTGRVGNNAASDSPGAEPEQTVPIKDSITVATVGNPNTEILKKADELLWEQGYELVIKECEDYDTPNKMLLEGTADCNFFQHASYLDRYNRTYQTNLTEVGKIYYEPMAIYAGKAKSLADIKEGAKIGVPSNPTGYAQALLLLQQEGLIELMSDADLTSVPEDISSNPLNLELVEMEEQEIPGALQELDAGIFHKGFSLQQGMEPEEGLLAAESMESMAAEGLAQILVVADARMENVAGEATDAEVNKETVTESEESADEKTENNTETKAATDKIQLLIQVLGSDKMQEFIDTQFQGTIMLYTDSVQEQVSE